MGLGIRIAGLPLAAPLFAHAPQISLNYENTGNVIKKEVHIGKTTQTRHIDRHIPTYAQAY